MELDSKLTTNKYIETLFSEVNEKVGAHISTEQALTLCNAENFVELELLSFDMAVLQ